MKKLFTAFALFSMFLTAGLLNAQETSSLSSAGMQFKESSWQEALDMAKQENKAIFVDCFADWCGPCNWMSANVFPTEEAGKYYNENFIVYKLDMEKGEGIEFAKKYEVKNYPTYIYFSPEGEPVHRTVGSKELADFIQDGRNAFDPEKQYYTLKARYTAGERGEDLLRNFALASVNAYDYNTEAIQDYMSTQSGEQLLSADNWKILNDYVTDVNSPQFKYLMDNREKFAEKYGKEDVDMKIASVNIEYYTAKRDWANYAKYVDEYIMQSNIQEQGFYNSMAWTIYENSNDKAVLKKALSWAKKSMNIKKDYYNTDTYASLLYKLGKYDEALDAANEAVKYAKKEGMDYSATSELIKMIKKKQD